MWVEAHLWKREKALTEVGLLRFARARRKRTKKKNDQTRTPLERDVHTILQSSLRAGLLLLLQKERQERHISNLHNLEPHTRQITDRVTGTPKPRHQNLVVVLHIAQRPIPGYESCNLLAVLDQLHTDRLPDGGVRLFGLNADPLQHNAFGVRGSGEGVGLQGRGRVLPRILLVVPDLLPAVVLKLAASAETRGLPATDSRGGDEDKRLSRSTKSASARCVVGAHRRPRSIAPRSYSTHKMIPHQDARQALKRPLTSAPRRRRSTTATEAP